MKSILHNQLNSAQQEAISRVNGPSIILAGAGSGKTRVLTYKTAYMVETGIDPSSILMATFTNKAAGEMKKRIQQFVSSQLGFVGTFHSLSASILRKHGHAIGVPPNFVIFDEDDKEALLKQVVLEVRFDGKLNIPTISHKISSAKDNLMTPLEFSKFSSNSYDSAIATAYTIYQKKLEENQAVDFDDLLFKSVNLFQKNPQTLKRFNDTFHYMLVDEFQDTNTAQYILSRLLAGDKQNITVVGDFSQSIYSWRGAEIRNLEKFQRDFKGTKVFYLEQNYRSTQNILDYAYGVISVNTSHPILQLFTENKSGEEVEVVQLGTDEEEALFIANKLSKYEEAELDLMAILYRVNSQSRAIEEAFLHYGIPYILIGGTRFYARREVKDILSYLRLIVNPKDSVSLERATKIGKRKLAKLQELSDKIKDTFQDFSSDEIVQKILDATDYLDLYNSDDEEDFSRLENIKELRSVALNFPDLNDLLQQVALVESEYSEAEKKKTHQGVKLMTMHQAKGLEFDTVFVVGVEEGLLPHARSVFDNHQLEEERRLFYVGVTRARKKLYITHAQYRMTYGRRIPSLPSRFLNIQSETSQEYYTNTGYDD